MFGAHRHRQWRDPGRRASRWRCVRRATRSPRHRLHAGRPQGRRPGSADERRRQYRPGDPQAAGLLRLSAQAAAGMPSPSTWSGSLAAKVSGLSQIVSQLSGGNQQKIVIGKWIARGGDIIIAEDPTRGVDVGAKFEIWRAIQELAESGKAVHSDHHGAAGADGRLRPDRGDEPRPRHRTFPARGVLGRGHCPLLRRLSAAVWKSIETLSEQ